MSYFDEVYLKRINKYGTTRQDRVEGRKEMEFDRLYLRDSQYIGNLYKVNDDLKNIECSLQPNKYNEDELISNLLLSRSSEKFNSGDIMYVYQKVKNVEIDKCHIALLKEENVGKGYSLYKVICLDEEINFTDEYGTSQYVIPVKIVSSEKQLVKDYFTISAATTEYREPNFETKVITKDFDFLKKGMQFDYKGKRFEITGNNNISIKGVAFLSIKEQLTKEPEPITSKEIPVSDNTNFFLNNR